jgi:hypothetical protein
MATPQKARFSAGNSDAGASAAKAQAKQASISPEKIAVRAYEIWQASGRPDGKHEEHWYTAERELRARTTRSS